MKIKTIALISLSACFLLGCAFQSPVRVSAGIGDRDYNLYKSRGSAQINGRAFFGDAKTATEDNRTCANRSVYLYPNTPYFREMFFVLKSGGTTDINNIDPSLIRKAKCDAQGNFFFSGLPEAGWFLMTDIPSWSCAGSVDCWDHHNHYRYNNHHHDNHFHAGETLVREIKTYHSETQRLLLTEGDVFRSSRF